MSRLDNSGKRGFLPLKPALWISDVARLHVTAFDLDRNLLGFASVIVHESD